jgi:alkyl sulfatase BDS1-like metallo-beta-lactamase superfamily hydrolase
MQSKPLIIAFLAAIGRTQPALAAEAPKEPTPATKAANAAVLKALPFNGKQSFDDAQRGLVAPLYEEIIKTQDGRPVWNPKQYAFIKPGAEAPGTVNPSLWRRQAQKADATVRIDRATLNEIVVGRTTLEKEITAGKVKVDGDAPKFGKLVALLDKVGFWFNIVTP